MIRFQEKLAHL